MIYRKINIERHLMNGFSEDNNAHVGFEKNDIGQNIILLAINNFIRCVKFLNYVKKRFLNAKVFIGLILSLAIMLLISFFCSLQADGQTISAQATLKNYNVSKKRLLALNTAQFIDFVTQDNLDQDSVMSLARRLTGLPFLLPYTENFQDGVSTPGTSLINAGKISEAENLVNSQLGEKQIMLIIELAIWYLHQPGADHTDIMKANYYIETAINLSKAGKYNKWILECKLLSAELKQQKGEIQESRKILNELVNADQVSENGRQTARAWQLLSRMLPYSDSTKLVCLDNAINICIKNHYIEKEIELLFSKINFYNNDDASTTEKNIIQILSLMQAISFKHTLYTEYIYSFIKERQGNYIADLVHARAGLDNMRWSGINAIEGGFFTRIGASYEGLGKNEVAMLWFNKAINSGTEETHIFWYKSMFFATTLLYLTDKPAESLTLLNSTIRKFPTITVWEKVSVLITKGLCYQKLKNFKLADEVYTSLLALVKRYPLVDPFGEITDTYFDIADSYVTQGNFKKAQLFLKMAMSNEIKTNLLKRQKFHLLSRIDSLQGNYKLALQDYIQYKYYYDADIRMDQRKQFDEITVKYAAVKKDRDIKILEQQKAAQQTELKRNKLTRKIMIVGSLLLLVIIGLLLNQFRLKQQSNEAISSKNKVLQHLLDEKEWLLKEVHHRVKNNLHTVICLLESQAAYLKDDALKAIESSQHRIYAMSLIHQKLYESNNVKTIDMGVYLPEFIQHLNDSFGTQNNRHFNVDIEPLQLGISQAIPLSLIVNEAVTNAIKYAFPLNAAGTITISLHKKNDVISLVIADDGIGIDRDITKRSHESLGLKLINGLSEDLNGHINFENNKGTRISITFNIDPISKEGGISSNSDYHMV
jgi:two-component sensor histidine kinase